MSDIDIESDAQTEVKQSQTDVTFSDFDYSGLTVRLEPPEYDSPQIVAKQPQEVWSTQLTNCTRQARTERIVKTHKSSSSWTVTLNAQIKLGRNMSAQNKVIQTLILASGFSVQIDLSAGTSYSGSREVSLTIDEATQVAPCTEIKTAIVESGAVYTIAFRLPLTVRGNIRCKMQVNTFLPSYFVSAPDVSFPYMRRYVIEGTAKVLGTDLQKNWNEFRATCPEGTPCRRLSTLSDDDFWKRVKPDKLEEDQPSPAD